MNKIIENKKVCVILIILLFLIVLFFCCNFFLRKNKLLENDEKLIFENITNKKEIGKLNSIKESNANIYYDISYPKVGNSKIDNKIENVLDELKNDIDKEFICDCSTIDHYYFVDYETYVGPNNIMSLVINEKMEQDNLKMVKDKVYSYIFDLKSGEILEKDDVFKGGYVHKLNEYIDSQDKINNNDFNYIINNDKIILIDYDVEIPIDELNEFLKIDLTLSDEYSSDFIEPEYEIINKEQQVTGDIVVYSEDSMNREIIGNVSLNTILKVYSKSDKGYSMILFDGKIGFIETKYLKDVMVKDESNEEEIVEKVVYVIMDVNVRSEASVKSELLGELKVGDEVTKVGENNNFTKILYKGGFAYVSSSCISLVKIEKRPIKLNVPPQGNIDNSKPMVALSFDDGPSIKSTTKILDILEKYNVRATFFDLGSLMIKYPDIVRREASLGEVGTHTYSHKNLNKASNEDILKEMNLSREAFIKVLGYEPILLRTPYGNANANVKAMVDMPIIGWSVDTLDWKYRNKDLILNEIDKYGNLDGKIILMHSIYSSTADAVEVLIPDLLDKGYQVVSVSELAYYKGYTLETGTTYYNFK